jgi:hypothetical protein
MAITYTTPELVQSEIRATSPFSNNTLPSLQSVNRWISEADAMIDQWSGFVAAETARTEIVDYDGLDYINLQHSPLVTVTSLLYNTNSLGSDDGEAWVTKTQGTDYFVYDNSGQILINFSKWQPHTGARRLKVLYISGYEDTPPIHQAIATKMVADRVLSSLLNNNIEQASDGGSVSVGSISIVEPGSYGVQNYKRLKEEVAMYKQQLLQGTGVYRYTV